MIIYRRNIHENLYGKPMIRIEENGMWLTLKALHLDVLASEIAKVLRGKNKPEYTPHIDTGDYVIVVNSRES